MPGKYSSISHFPKGSTFLTGLLLAFSAITAPAVEIPDSALETAIRDELGKPTGEITSEDMETLTSLSATDLNITDLTGLEAAENLTRLYLGHNQISDISALSGLTGLTELRIDSNQLSDISALSGLTGLTYIFLHNNQISDISGLMGLANLKKLYLENNQISDISALSGLTNLTELYLQNNQISDINALSGLTNLIWLYLHYNQISDINALSNLSRLRFLNVSYNLLFLSPGSAARTVIESIRNSVIRVFFDPQNDSDDDGMWDPFELFIIEADSGDTLTTLADVLPGDDFDGDGWTNLDEFNDDTDPTDPTDFFTIVPIPDANLEEAIRRALGNSTGDMTVVDMKRLTSLHASQYDIIELTGLEAAVNLTTLNLSNNQISDINALSGLTGLRRLDLDRNQISDISALSGLTDLYGLEINHNQISDISALSGLDNLRELVVSYNLLLLITNSPAHVVIENLQNGGTGVYFKPQVDADDDGMWDPFELLIIEADSSDSIITLADVLPGDDFDGDGRINVGEFSDSTDPTDPVDIATIVNIPDANLKQAIRGTLHTPTDDISVVEMGRLYRLNANYGITDLTGLEAAVNLTEIFLNCNQISDINAISGLTRLTNLSLENNQISDISALSGLSGLHWLNISHNLLLLTINSPARAVIESLQQGYTVVTFEPQKDSDRDRISDAFELLI